jgi:hypothetical protein
MPMSAKFARELYCAQQLATHLGLPVDLDWRDPLVEKGYETGADVFVQIGSRRIGIQVSEYDGGEGQPSAKPGQMRAAEARLIAEAGPDGVYGGWGSPKFNEAFTARVEAKVEKCKLYSFAEYDEIWLLIAANVPGAGLSTFVPYFHIGPDRLDLCTRRILSSSSYKRAFLDIIMRDTLFGWDRENSWQCFHKKASGR